MKVIIIGGGIGGLTLAIALAKLGIDAQVFERAPELREVGAGIALAANALNALDVLGLGDALRSRSLPGMPGGIKNSNGQTLTSIPLEDMADGSVAVLHRAELLAFLAQQLDPERLHLGREYVGCETRENRIVARFLSGETVEGDLLIGADGLKSVVRTQLFGQKFPRYAGYTAWRAVVEFTPPDRQIVEIWGPGRRFGIVPMSRGRTYWFAVNNAPEGQRDPEGQTKPILAKLFQGWPEPIGALLHAAQEASILRNDIYDLDPLAHLVRDRVALMGDAAHPMTPNLGQGACQAIEDAVALAACLGGKASIAAALEEFERRRIPRASQVVMQARRLGNVAQMESPVLCWVRNAALRLTPRRVALRQIKALHDFELLTPMERKLFL